MCLWTVFKRESRSDKWAELRIVTCLYVCIMRYDKNKNKDHFKRVSISNKVAMKSWPLPQQRTAAVLCCMLVSWND